MRPIDAEPILKFIEDGLNEKDPQKHIGYDGIRIMTEIQFAPTIESPRPDWTPCVEGKNLPTKNDAYLVTIEEKKTSERWTTTLRFMDGEWLASDHYRILAWMKPEPYNPDRKED